MLDDWMMAPTRTASPAPARRADFGTAIASIIGFWLFYFTIISLRAALMGFDDQLDMLARRAVVTMVGMVLTFGLYSALSPFAGRALRQRVAAAALLIVPFAALFAAFNWAAFYAYDPVDRQEMTGNAASAPMDDEMVAPEEFGTVAKIVDGTVTWYFFFAAWAAMHLALGYAADVGAAERRAASYRAAARDAEIRALRYQVNPHFLFNTLNSLSTLVMRNRPEEAERMILNLSTFFRTSLTADAAQDLSLDEELRLQRLYLDIEAVRFPERLRVNFDVAPGLGDACIPGLLLQPLVENAIKHGVSRAGRPVTLSIRATSPAPERIEIVVENDGPAGDADPADTLFEPQAGTGTGLRNVRERLNARFGQDAAIRWGPRSTEGYAVNVSLPLVHHGC